MLFYEVRWCANAAWKLLPDKSEKQQVWLVNLSSALKYLGLNSVTINKPIYILFDNYANVFGGPKSLIIDDIAIIWHVRWIQFSVSLLLPSYPSYVGKDFFAVFGAFLKQKGRNNLWFSTVFSCSIWILWCNALSASSSLECTRTRPRLPLACRWVYHEHKSPSHTFNCKVKWVFKKLNK